MHQQGLHQIQEPVRNTIVGDLPLKIEPFKQDEKNAPKISFDDIKEKYSGSSQIVRETDWNLLYFVIGLTVFGLFLLFLHLLPDMVGRKSDETQSSV